MKAGLKSTPVVCGYSESGLALDLEMSEQVVIYDGVSHRRWRTVLKANKEEGKKSPNSVMVCV